MSTVAETTNTGVLVSYSVTDAAIAELAERFTGLSCDTSEGYEQVRLAIAEVRGLRVAIEERRVELKADALAFGRKVDAEAKRITVALEAIENPLKKLKQVVDDEKERARVAAAEAKRLELEAQLNAAREAEEARLKAIRDAEDARLAKERAELEAERQRLEDARRKGDAEEAERQARVRAEQEAEAAKLKAERDALDAERRKVQAEKDAADRVEFERQARIKAEREAAEKVERDRIAALEREAELARLLPDVEKVRAFAAAIDATPRPKVKSKKVAAIVTTAEHDLSVVVAYLREKAGAL